MTRIKRNIRPSNRRGVNTLGKIKVGDKKINKSTGKEYPVSLDHFRFTSPTKGYAEKALILFGQTNTLKVTFLSNNDENNCCQRYELRTTGGSLVAHTDLEKLFVSKEEGIIEIEQSVIQESGGIHTVMKKLEKRHGTKFFECLYLRVVLLGFPIVGQWEIYTKGVKSSIDSIIGTYDMTKELAGRVMGVPFNLTVSKVKSNRDLGKDDRGRNKVRYYPVISLHTDLSLEAQEDVKYLGNQLSGVITPDKIKKLSSPGAQQDNHQPKKEEIFTEAEVMS